MNIENLKKQLAEEGYKKIYIWEDLPDSVYEPHSHRISTKIIILDGEMSLRLDGKVGKLKKGDMAEIAARQLHSAVIGQEGCRYLVGEGKK